LGTEHLKVEDGRVVTLAYTLKVDGKVVDTSEGPDGEPIQFIQGSGQIIPGLEKALYGLSVGDHKEVEVPPEEGYGERDPEAHTEMDRSEFPKNVPLKPGVELQLTDEGGQVFEARIESVEGETVHLDFNHPLAGKTLNFAVQVVALRDASPSELEHGHVHGAEHEH
jgi:FKBP-type peptidyl-prolyl cis-trans isomerase SlyD